MPVIYAQSRLTGLLIVDDTGRRELVSAPAARGTLPRMLRFRRPADAAAHIE